MTPHCKGCSSHWNAGHPPKSPHRKCNDWCCHLGKPASKAIGECKLKGLKSPKGRLLVDTA